jgi:hypothetical protein
MCSILDQATDIVRTTHASVDRVLARISTALWGTGGPSGPSVWLAGSMSHLTPVPSDPDGLQEWLTRRREADVDLGFEWRNPEVELPPAPEEAQALTVDVSLQGTDPPVWRRLVVPGDTALDDLHDVLQAAMGWTDSHPHRFFVGTSPRSPYLVTPWDREEDDQGTPEDEVRLDQLLPSVGETVLYEYDFGDGWDHDLRLEETAPLAADSRARCTGGEGACPPEDVGGVSGYAEVADWVRGGRRPDAVPDVFESFEQADDWLPADWHPDTFDVTDTDLRLQALAATAQLLGRLEPGALEAVEHLSPEVASRISAWVVAASRTTLSPTELDEIAAPYRTLLDAVGDGIQLTAAGYLPGPAVQALCPALGIDPHVAGKANRESNVHPLLEFREGMQRSGLLRASRRVLKPTELGTSLVAQPEQLWRHVAGALPYGDNNIELEGGWFTLLAVAGGVGESEVFDEVGDLCADAGWVGEDDQPISRWAASTLLWPVLAALMGPRWSSIRSWPSWVPAAAASALFVPAGD